MNGLQRPPCLSSCLKALDQTSSLPPKHPCWSEGDVPDWSSSSLLVLESSLWAAEAPGDGSASRSSFLPAAARRIVGELHDVDESVGLVQLSRSDWRIASGCQISRSESFSFLTAAQTAICFQYYSKGMWLCMFYLRMWLTLYSWAISFWM